MRCVELFTAITNVCIQKLFNEYYRKKNHIGLKKVTAVPLDRRLIHGFSIEEKWEFFYGDHIGFSHSWVVRFNVQGADGLINSKASGEAVTVERRTTSGLGASA